MPKFTRLGEAQAFSQHDDAARYVPVWYALIALALAVALAITMRVPTLSGLERLAVVGLTALYALWYWAFVAHLGWWRERDGWVFFSFFGAILLALALCRYHSIYLMLLYSLLGISFSMLVDWAAVVVCVAVTISLLGTRIGFGALFDPTRRYPVIGFVLASAAWIVCGLFISTVIHQSNERRRALEDLQAARAELARAERQAGVLQERQRLAGEIHDTLAQGLASIVMQLEAAEQTLDEDLNLGRQHLARARDTARRNLEEARRVVWALQPQALESETLGQALAQTVQRWSHDHNVEATLSVTGTARDLTPGIEATLLRAAQEALANVAKHAGAHHVNVTLSYLSDQVILDIQDDGGGFDPRPWLEAHAAIADADGGAPTGGFGLAAMRDRARQLGGTLEVDSQPGAGTTVTVLLPFQGAREVTP